METGDDSEAKETGVLRISWRIDRTCSGTVSGTVFVFVDGSLVRKRGACLVEDIDGKQVLLVRETGNNNITYNS